MGFATIELKSNHLATAPVGHRLLALATLVHRGRTTQVWDATVTAAGAADEGREGADRRLSVAADSARQPPFDSQAGMKGARDP